MAISMFSLTRCCPMYSTRRFGRTLASMRASSSYAAPDTMRSWGPGAIMRFALASAMLFSALPLRLRLGERYLFSRLAFTPRPGLVVPLAHSRLAAPPATTSRNCWWPLGAWRRPRRFPRRARRSPDSRARTPRPPHYLPETRPPARPLRFPPRACPSARRPCAPRSSAPPRESSSAAPDRCRESRAPVLRRSFPTESSAPARAPRPTPTAASQRNVFRARTEIRRAPGHLRAHGCGSAAGLRYEARRARRTLRAAPARHIPRRPHPQEPGSAAFLQAAREAGQSSLDSIAARTIHVNAAWG